MDMQESLKRYFDSTCVTVGIVAADRAREEKWRAGLVNSKPVRESLKNRFPDRFLIGSDLPTDKWHEELLSEILAGNPETIYIHIQGNEYTDRLHEAYPERTVLWSETDETAFAFALDIHFYIYNQELNQLKIESGSAFLHRTLANPVPWGFNEYIADFLENDTDCQLYVFGRGRRFSDVNDYFAEVFDGCISEEEIQQLRKVEGNISRVILAYTSLAVRHPHFLARMKEITAKNHYYLKGRFSGKRVQDRQDRQNAAESFIRAVFTEN